MVLLLLLAGAYVAPGDCPSEAAFFAAVARRTESSTVGLEIEIERVQDRVAGRLRLDGAERVVEASRCAELVEALALVASLLLESPDPPVEPEAPSLPFAAISPTSAARLSTPAIFSRGELAWSAGALGAATAGVVPGVGFGVPLFVQLDGARGSLRVTGSWAEANAQPSVGGAHFTQLGARTEVCPSAWALGVGFTVSGCGAIEAGVLLASAVGVDAAKSVAQPWISAGALARLGYYGLDPFFLEAQAGALIPLLRPRFVFDPGLVVHEVALVTGFLAAGGGLRFW